MYRRKRWQLKRQLAEFRLERDRQAPQSSAWELWDAAVRAVESELRELDIQYGRR